MTNCEMFAREMFVNTIHFDHLLLVFVYLTIFLSLQTECPLNDT